MALLDRIARADSLPSNEKVTGHRIENALVLYFHGKVTRTQMIDIFGIPPAMEADFDQFKTKYDSFGSSAAQVDLKHQYVQDVIACVTLLQLGDITKTQFNTFTGLTLTT